MNALTTLAIVAVASAWPAVSAGQTAPAPAVQQQPGQHGDHQDQAAPGDDHAAHHPASPPMLPPHIPPLTDADRAAAFPDVEGHPVHGSAINYFVLFDRLEWQGTGGAGGMRWENKGWIGGDRDRFWFRTEGGGDDGRLDTARGEALYGRAIAPWWDVVAGIRQDVRPGSPQTWAAVGLQGLAPYGFDVEATAYVGPSGRTHFRLETEYELLLTNRLILQPRVEMDVYGKSDPERQIGAGLGAAEAGLRLRYEIRRELAPYVGVAWNRAFLGTADRARAAGHSTQGTRLALGLRLWL